MSEAEKETATTTDTDESPKRTKQWFNWNDPNVPAGNGPADFPKWPLAMACIVWLCGLAFLLTMLASRS